MLKFSIGTRGLIGMACAAVVMSAPVVANPASVMNTPQDVGSKLSAPPAPRLWHLRAPSAKLMRARLADSKNLSGVPARPLAVHVGDANCQDMNLLAAHHGNDLANYLVALPDYSCTYNLFSLSPQQAATIYSPGNLNAVASRFMQEASAYRAKNMALVNLTLYLRAGYYLADMGVATAPDAGLRSMLRPSIKSLLDGNWLFAANAQGPTSAGEIMNLISNMKDEAQYLDRMKTLVMRYTNGPSQPNAAQAVRETTADQGFTGILTVFYSAHGRSDALPLLQSDPSYSQVLYRFALNDKASLSGTESAYQLGDAVRESLRFLQYPALKAVVGQETRSILAASSMTGPENDLWLAAAEAVQFYDEDQCASYGTCNFADKLANAVLSQRHTCSAALQILSQEMTSAQMQSSCATLQTEEAYFHQKLNTHKVPVADDDNRSLDMVVFDDYDNYSKYASVIYGVDTNNGGIYVEGEPSNPQNQARFIAYEASWLRPTFQVWNMKHEFVHYLDGRFDMYGDFAQSTAQPTVWWIEGLAEYISKQNDDQPAIDAARSQQYHLSQIYGNTYAMNDYENRAYLWGYMATRFMMEKHPADVHAILGKFRVGDYSGYQQLMDKIGTRYDKEFNSWAQSATPLL